MSVRVCIVAENASKRFGGEAILPYHYFRVLRKRGAEAWLVVHARTRPELEQLFPEDLNRIVFVEDRRAQKILVQLGARLPRRVADATSGLAVQFLTQLSQRAIVRQLVRERGVEVVHQPTPVAPRFPSLMSHLGSPVVIGPMNGGMEYPPAFRTQESALTRWFVAALRALSGIVHFGLRGKRDASVLLAANERTRAVLPSCPNGTVIVLPENAVDLDLWQVRSPADVSPAAFVYVGRLVDWKRVDLLLRAIERTPGATLDVLGDGVCRTALESLAKQLGVAGRVRFHGYRTQEECARLVSRATALVLASLYESGGAVVLEAMAVGTPAIVTAWGGPVDYVDPTCAILVPVGSEEGMIGGIAEAMRSLSADPERAAEMGREGRRRIEREFNWERKVDAMQQIYRDAANKAHAPQAQRVADPPTA